jgi:hypothetical protein
MPIVYSEYGIESAPPGTKAGKYTGSEPTTTKPVGPKVQASYYRLAIQIAFCQPTVRVLSLFLLSDEPSLGRWQSGLYYVDRTPKPSAAAVSRAAREVRRGVVARCPGLRLPVKASASFGPPATLARARPLSFRLRCNIDCSYVARVERLADGKAALVARGRAVGHVLRTVRFKNRGLPGGRYRVRVTVVAPVNPGTPSTLSSLAFRLVKPRPRGTPPGPPTARPRSLP